ncbi:acyl-CoA thioesterase [Parvularcula flava]|uniref:Thioesterase n=1 Tax=Aquisalinus luteolus TaxID=1566827 RepID=A0A8J3ERJ7_9PROT|nr:thioesterase family protein [Aquisalinus luteolus]NHK28642.1 acyl-CoA thioesterase [Aquisalinus luteolus]GGH99089.1 thioesterase [Aquisalinus luteolus]
MNNNGKGAVSLETAFTREIFATVRDIDVLGHVNNAVYLRWVQDVAVRHWRKVAPLDLQEQVIFVVLRHEIDYRDPITTGDKAVISTWLGKAKGPRFDRYVDIRKEGASKFSARALTTWCMKDKKTGRPLRITDEIFDIFGLDPAEFRE